MNWRLASTDGIKTMEAIMRYMIRDVFTCKRGEVPEYLELLKIVI
jgi:hypothetical protein|tara:strand:+ start:629 stop:763 length:135 start_codon:yes stop_codon:yes gene_type:complete